MLATPADPKESEELTQHRLADARRLRQGQVVPGSGEARRLPQHRRRHAGAGRARATSRSCAASGKAGTRSRRRCGRTTRASPSCRTRARRSSGSPTPARCGARSTTCRPTRSRRSSIGCGIRCGRSTSQLHAYVRMKLRAEVRRRRAGERARFRRICSATSGRRTGRTSIRWSRPPASDAGYSLTDILKRRKIAPLDMVRIGERFYTSLGFAPLPPTFWERSLFVRPQRPRGGLPRQRLGHRLRGRRPHQDVHRADGGGLLDHPPRARAQLLPARLQGPAGASSATAPTTASTKRSATPSRCR